MNPHARISHVLLAGVTAASFHRLVTADTITRTLRHRWLWPVMRRHPKLREGVECYNCAPTWWAALILLPGAGGPLVLVADVLAARLVARVAASLAGWDVERLVEETVGGVPVEVGTGTFCDWPR